VGIARSLSITRHALLVLFLLGCCVGAEALKFFYCTCNKEKQPNVTVLHIIKGYPVLICGKVKGKA
jgi:hypothetical protein